MGTQEFGDTILYSQPAVAGAVCSAPMSWSYLILLPPNTPEHWQFKRYPKPTPTIGRDAGVSKMAVRSSQYAAPERTNHFGLIEYCWTYNHQLRSIDAWGGQSGRD